MFTGLLLFLSFGEQNRNSLFSLIYSPIPFLLLLLLFYVWQFRYSSLSKLSICLSNASWLRYLVWIAICLSVCLSVCVLSHFKDLNCLTTFHQTCYEHQFEWPHLLICSVSDNMAQGRTLVFGVTKDAAVMYGNRSWRNVASFIMVGWVLVLWSVKICFSFRFVWGD